MRRAFTLILYNLVVVCVALVAAEYATRRIKHVPSSQWDFRLDRWTAYRNNPAFDRGVVRHTHEGFRRDRPVSLEKPSNTVRIFLMGGSVAYGGNTLYPEIDHSWRIDNRQTIDYYLEQKLNAAFPVRRWEVINAAVKGYMLHQDLALFLSLVQRYQPDYVILLDGNNDLNDLLMAPEHFDPYTRTPLADEFDNLTNPRSFRSLSVMLSTWLANNSVLYRGIRERVLRRTFVRSPVVRAADERQLDYYPHEVLQIHRLLALDGVQDLFVLQPVLLLTRKAPAGPEARLVEHHRAVMGSLFVSEFETFYPKLGDRLAAGAQGEGYGFLNLISVFDNMQGQAFTDDCHLTPDGNRAVADALFAFLTPRFSAQ